MKNNWYLELQESLDKHFPKGKCKERGPALVFFAEAFRLIDQAVKAYGGCTKCYGKGYGTQTIFSSGYGDFSSSKEVRRKLNSMVFCVCPRGKQLKELLKG